MPDLFYATDRGPAIVENGIVYIRVGLEPGTVNDSNPDIDGITSFTYNNPDNQGKTVYTAGERALSRYVPANYNTVFMSANDTWYNVFTAPSAGVCRLWVGGEPVSVRVNGGSALVMNFGAGGEAEAYPLNVQAGEVIDIMYDANNSRTGYCTFLPFLYP